MTPKGPRLELRGAAAAPLTSSAAAGLGRELWIFACVLQELCLCASFGVATAVPLRHGQRVRAISAFTHKALKEQRYTAGHRPAKDNIGKGNDTGGKAHEAKAGVRDGVAEHVFQLRPNCTVTNQRKKAGHILPHRHPTIDVEVEHLPYQWPEVDGQRAHHEDRLQEHKKTGAGATGVSGHLLPIIPLHELVVDAAILQDLVDDPGLHGPKEPEEDYAGNQPSL
eukprot:CAMPEP_0171060316 /NCGR_PEP_ID=MMETSP0766_2-20121228/3758_1 /TAXON_ID=439317 /ORGANISM="Gambierdiscus australes, Strain CAWD 149" /LENGTH=223 /DNA_ID=CAMNT_0011515879 /DNA_START=51 /DNA_END=723 /DNA_ORIENTATION=-